MRLWKILAWKWISFYTFKQFALFSTKWRNYEFIKLSIWYESMNQSISITWYYFTCAKSVLKKIIMNFVLGNECTPCMSNTTSYLQAGHRILLPPFLEFLIGSDLLSKIFWQHIWQRLWLHGNSTTGGFSLSRHSWQLVILSYFTSKIFFQMTPIWP